MTRVRLIGQDYTTRPDRGTHRSGIRMPYPWGVQRSESWRRSAASVFGLVVAGVAMVALAMSVRP